MAVDETSGGVLVVRDKVTVVENFVEVTVDVVVDAAISRLGKDISSNATAIN